MDCITKDSVIKLMHDIKVYDPPIKKDHQSVHAYEKSLKAYIKRVDTLAERLELVAEAYEDNFKEILSSQKYSRGHLKLVIIDELLNAESYRIRVALRIRPKDPKQEKGIVGSGGPTIRRKGRTAERI
ncbi:MAG: hypothetical protein A4E53_01645 [Pelotomaculum sp. PtaB.Bin104]|nr:MAG: hypothetical protein A4E53_01645 [Pelotomaculum sp. PtaB.Bin104]